GGHAAWRHAAGYVQRRTSPAKRAPFRGVLSVTAHRPREMWAGGASVTPAPGSGGPGGWCGWVREGPGTLGACRGLGPVGGDQVSVAASWGSRDSEDTP